MSAIIIRAVYEETACTDPKYFTIDSKGIVRCNQNNLSSFPDHIIIPSSINGIKSLEVEEMYFAKNLQSVILPDSITVIRDSAFMELANLKSINFPPNLQKIGASAFFNTSLQSVVLPEGFTRLETGSFQRCMMLTSVTIPSTIKHIGPTAFSESTNLKNIFVNRSEDPALGAPWGAINANVVWTP